MGSRWTARWVGMWVTLGVLGPGCGPEVAVRAPRVARTPAGDWPGQCNGVKVWSQVRIKSNLQFTGTPDALEAVGVFEFINRTARVTLNGARTERGGYLMRGQMTELTGLGVTWSLRLEIEPPSERGEVLSGTLYELQPDADQVYVICDFVWSRRR